MKNYTDKKVNWKWIIICLLAIVVAVMVVGDVTINKI